MDLLPETIDIKIQNKSILLSPGILATNTEWTKFKQARKCIWAYSTDHGITGEKLYTSGCPDQLGQISKFNPAYDSYCCMCGGEIEITGVPEGEEE